MTWGSPILAVTEVLLRKVEFKFPTNGFGRIRGGLSVLDFLKLQTVVETKKSALSEISDNLKILTDAEGLPNHYKAVEKRLK